MFFDYQIFDNSKIFSNNKPMGGENQKLFDPNQLTADEKMKF